MGLWGRVALIVAVSLFAAGCGSSESGDETGGESGDEFGEASLSCLPEGIFRFEERTARQASTAAPRGVDIYFDVSLANVGYGAPELEQGYSSLPYRNLVSALFDLQQTGMDVELNGFAATLEPVEGPALTALARGEARCALREAASCQRTDLRLPFEAIRSDLDRPSIIVSDLMFRDPDLFNPGPMNLSHTIRAAVAAGKSIGVIGIKAPFRGALYDMPGAVRVWEDARRVEGRRVFSPVRYMPLFVMIIGTNAEIDYLRSHIARHVFDGQSVEHRFSRFTPELLRDAAALVQVAAPGMETPHLSPAFFIRPEGVGAELLQLRLDRRSLRELHAGQIREQGAVQPGASPLHIRFPIDDKFWEGSALTGAVRLSVQTYQSWSLRQNQTCQSDWEPLALPASAGALGAARRDPQTGQGHATVNLDDEVWLNVDSRYVHLVHFSLSLEPEPGAASAPEWMRQWSFEPADADRLRESPPEFFPILSLSSLGRILDREVREAARSEDLGEGAVYIEIR